MDCSTIWKDCFRNWPKDMARHGVLVTTFGEQVPFENFSISDHLLLLDRRAPDTVGARRVLLAYDQIVALKIVEVVKPKVFEAMGFHDTARLK